MTEKEFEVMKESPSTVDILKWIIKEFKDGGAKKRTLIAFIKNMYKSV